MLHGLDAQETPLTAIRGQTAVGRRRVAKSPDQSKRVVVPFEDNRHLTRLLGEFDANLALVEDRLGITMTEIVKGGQA